MTIKEQLENLVQSVEHIKDGHIYTCILKLKDGNEIKGFYIAPNHCEEEAAQNIAYIDAIAKKLAYCDSMRILQRKEGDNLAWQAYFDAI